MADEEFSERDRAMLEFERLRWRYAGAKDSAILEQFGMTRTRYSQVLNQLLDRPDAMAYDAVTVKRLRRLRDQRRAVRSTARITSGR
ncbi:DUF3263 domain-containing protein [Nocardioides sp. SLBN-35]|uniref:DUF3263 domain-containing protein n=1 Tax=Nocardioides sp. SLBN-35 TaxID=2768445 RepID=UPI00115457BD|nr:DUF3263 domain-containing protein [Nocardioides sp. SLBN-35]